ncbi:MAG: hypothetical protein Q9184_004735 [Pyrenodesmia sp. 2 TL-2023]
MSSSHDDGFFNDLSRQPSIPDSTTQNVANTSNEAQQGGAFEVPKPKRVACAICRKRKLKCDGGRPKCGTCARLGHSCAYDEVRRKSGPKRGYVKELEARLAQVETQLQTKAKGKKPPRPSESNHAQDQTDYTPSTDPPLTSDTGAVNTEMYTMGIPDSAEEFYEKIALPNDNSPISSMLPDLNTTASSIDDGMTWEMIGLGLEEPLPTQEAIDEFHEIYFRYVHPSIPMLHQYRYRAAMGLSPHMRPPVCLRYAIWCLGSNLSERYKSHQEIFYRRARRYAEMDEMKGLGEGYVSVAHAQCWVLISTYEFQMMFFPRAWASVGRAVRLCLMMGLNRLDWEGLDVKQVLGPPRDWTEKEERRRTFWMAFCTDRYASLKIRTNLPANEENFDKSVEETTLTLSASMTPEGAARLSPFAGVVYMASIFGKNLTHLHRPGVDENDDDLQGEFWKRHRQLDNMLLKTSLSLPLHLRLPAGIRNPNCVFLNMCIHTSTICLHQAALFKAENKNLPPSLMDQSSTRCSLAAAELTNIMRLISHLDCRGMNPFISFCLYVAARVFIHVLKKTPGEAEVRSSLEFLLAVMQSFKTTNPLSESFLIQVGLDLQGGGIGDMLQTGTPSASTLARLELVTKYESNVHCSPLIDIRDIKKHMHSARMSPDQLTATCGPPQIIAAGVDIPSRPTQYSMQSFDLPSHPSPKPGKNRKLDGPLPDFLGKITHYGPGFPSDVAGLGNMGSTYDTDMSGGTSSGTTPGNSSSNTSYSPPSQNDMSGATVLPKPTAFQHADMGGRTLKMFNFNTAGGDFLPASPSQSQQNNADMELLSSTWNFDPAASPSNFTTGLTPAADGEWSQILDNMNWDSTMADANTTQWATSPGGTS